MSIFLCKIKRFLSNNLIITILFFIGLFFRGYRLGSKSLWYDEAFALLESQRKFLDLLNNEGIHPPLYRIIMHFWGYLGHGEAFLRTPSLVFSLFSIIFGYKIAELIFNKRIGLYAAAIMVISPFQVYFAQENRAHSLLFLLSLLSIYFFLKALKENKVILWVGYIFFMSLSMYTHYFGIINICSQNLFILLFHNRYKSRLFRWVISQSLVFLLFSPWLTIFVQHSIRVSQDFWIPSASVQYALTVFKNFFFGYYTSNLKIILLLVLVGIISLLGISSIVLFRVNPEDNLSWGRKERIAIFLSYLFIPAAVIFIFSNLARSIFLDRAFITASFFCYVILAIGIDAIRKNKLVLFCLIVALVTIHGISLKNYYDSNNYYYSFGVSAKEKPFRDLAKYINLNYHSGDIIILSHYSLWPSLKYYLADKIQNQIFLVSTPSSDTDKYAWLKLKQSFSPESIDIKENKELKSNVWIICSNWYDSPFISQELQSWMKAHKQNLLLTNKEYSGIENYYFKYF